MWHQGIKGSTRKSTAFHSYRFGQEVQHGYLLSRVWFVADVSGDIDVTSCLTYIIKKI